MFILLMLGVSSNIKIAIMLIVGGVFLYARARSLAEAEGSWSRWSQPDKKSKLHLVRILGAFFVAFGAAVIVVRAFWP